MKKYNKTNISFAQHLRKNMTPWERKLWYEFLNRYPVRFQRQKAIGEYIVDFYCAKAHLAVELDGGGHYCEEQITADEMRTQALKAMGVRVIRICNIDVDRNFRGVCEFLDREVQNSLPQSAALTAPSSEGAKNTPRRNRIFALGFFDGVHLGHQALLSACRELAQQAGCDAGVVTFLGHPDTLVRDETPKLINTPDDRRRLICRYGVDNLIELPFDRALMQMPWQDFFALLLQKGAAGLVCGSDFRFGFRGEGTADKLAQACAEAGIRCRIIDQQMLGGIRISSTHIRSLLEQGQMEQAVAFLGHPHLLTGRVISGKQLGRTLGIPTANLRLPEDCVVPAFGVYACKARVAGREYLAVTNIGTRPTVQGQGVTVEPWILDFDGDLYGQELTLEFYSLLRPERKFPSLADLREEILKNAQQTRNFFEKQRK